MLALPRARRRTIAIVALTAAALLASVVTMTVRASAEPPPSNQAGVSCDVDDGEVFISFVAIFQTDTNGYLSAHERDEVSYDAYRAPAGTSVQLENANVQWKSTYAGVVPSFRITYPGGAGSRSTFCSAESWFPST